MIKELKIDLDKCVHCGQCKYVCFVNVIEWDEEKKIPYPKYKQDCQACCICEAACPQDAITVIPDFTNKYYPRYISTMGRVEK